MDVRPVWPGQELRVGANRLFVRRAPAAAPDAEPALYVHGLGGASTNWTDLMGLLSDRLDGAAVDLPGFGRSAPPANHDYRPAAHSAVVVELLEQLDLGPVHLFGNSLGGAVCVRLAALRPDLVRTLTLVSPALPVLRVRRTNAHLPALATPFLGQQLLSRLGKVPASRRVQATLALCYADPSSVPAARVEEALQEAERRAGLGYEGTALIRSLQGLLAGYLTRGPESPWRLAARIAAPTLLIYGLQDKLVDPRSALRAVRTIPKARLLTLPDSGHVAQMEHPEVVAAAVRQLLDREVPRSTTPVA